MFFLFLNVFFHNIYIYSESLYVMIVNANLKSTAVVLITKKILFYFFR